MSDYPRVGDARCGCGYFDTGSGLAKVHDKNCADAPKKVAATPTAKKGSTQDKESKR